MNKPAPYIDIPPVKYVPSWFPGASFKKKAARWNENNDRMINRPFDAVKESLVGRSGLCDFSYPSLQLYARYEVMLDHPLRQVY